MEYPYIPAYCDIMSSFPYFTKGEIEKARKLNAPDDTYAFSGVYIEEPLTVSALSETNPMLAERIKRRAKAMGLVQ